MTGDKQEILSNEEADRELEEAETEFGEKNKIIAAQQSGEPIGGSSDPRLEEAETEFINKQKEEKGTIKKVDDTPLTKDILIALGFVRYDNGEKGIAYKLHAGPLQIGRTYNEKYPNGNMWVRCLKDCEYGKAGDFPKRDECKKIPLVALFYKIRDGELPIPEPTITGKVVGKSEKAVQIQFEEFGQTETEWWGFGALKKTTEGTDYIPASYSKETEKYTAKMQASRDILLKDYEAELEAAEMTISTDNSEHRQETKEKGDRGTVADKIPHKEPVILTEGEKPTVDYYISLIGEITAKVQAEERIPKGEWGYAISKVFDAITKDKRAALIAELQNKGGDHEGA